MSYELLFIMFGIAWAGLALFVLSIMIGIRRLITPKPKPTLQLALLGCRIHGSFWSDSGETCPHCHEEEPEEYKQPGLAPENEGI